MALSVGTKAPDFSLKSKQASGLVDVKLGGNFGKKNTLLLFFPLAFTSVCTQEMCDITSGLNAYSDLNADVIGISGDYVFSHHEWAKHHDLPFRLASDHSHEVAKRYGSFNEAYGYNRRTVFVVDKAGKIAYADLAYSSRDAASFEKLQAALKALK